MLWNFWWPTLTTGVKRYVNSCDLCCRSKCLCTEPLVLLHALPISILVLGILGLHHRLAPSSLSPLMSSLRSCTLFPFTLSQPPRKGPTFFFFWIMLFWLHELPTIIWDQCLQFISHFLVQTLENGIAYLLTLSPIDQRADRITEPGTQVIPPLLSELSSRWLGHPSAICRVCIQQFHSCIHPR